MEDGKLLHFDRVSNTKVPKSCSETEIGAVFLSNIDTYEGLFEKCIGTVINI